MKILLTGGLGHIGSYLIKHLENLQQIKKIYLVDNISNNRHDVLLNLKNEKISFLYGDLTNNIFCNKIPKSDIVIHLASLTNSENSFDNKKFIFFNNINSFKNIIKYCLKFDAKLIHFSSTSVYGPQKNIVTEETKKLFPQSPYAKIKLIEEKLLKKEKKINYISLRLGTISGFSKGMRFHTAVNKFCFNAVMKIPIPIWNNALNLYRPYLSLKDLLKIIKFIIKKKFFPCDLFNIVSENKTVSEILNLIVRNKFIVKKKFIKSKIHQKTSFFTSVEKFEKVGPKINSKIAEDIHLTLKKLKK